MFKNLGAFIRMHRTRNGLALNELARRLDVSPAYLSNLENGKTETVQLSFLEQLEQELPFTWKEAFELNEISELDILPEKEIRIQAAIQRLCKLTSLNPPAAEAILSLLELNMAFFESQWSNVLYGPANHQSSIHEIVSH